MKIVVWTDGIDFGMYSQRPFEWYMTSLPKLKTSWRRGKQYTSPVSLGWRHKNVYISIISINRRTSKKTSNKAIVYRPPFEKYSSHKINVAWSMNLWLRRKNKFKLDVDPQRDDDASPMSTNRWYLLECWFQLFSTSQNTSQIQFQTFLKKNQIFGSHVVVLVKTFPLTYQLLT